MSYDLAFFADGDLNLHAVRAWLTARPNWEVTGSQAMYSNEDTGVYFVVDIAPSSDADEPVLEASINLYRPSFFILEIEPEISRLVEEFGLGIEDGQSADPSDRTYSPERLRNGWISSNADAGRILAADDSSPARMSTERLTALWEWNFGIAALQERWGDDFFVPRIMAFRDAGGVKTAVTWADGIPTIFPRVDSVIVFRDNLAPRRVFRRRRDAVLRPWDEVAALIAPHSTARPDGGLDFIAPRPPDEVAAWFRGLPGTKSLDVEGVPYDQLHDAE